MDSVEHSDDKHYIKVRITRPSVDVVALSTADGITTGLNFATYR